MARYFCILVLVPLLVCSISNGHEETDNVQDTTSTPLSTTTTVEIVKTTSAPQKANDTSLEKANCTKSNSSDCGDDRDKGVLHSVKEFWRDNLDMIKRTLYVLMGLTGIVVVYFGVKYCRLRRRKTKKYGIVTAADTHELQPLDMDDDDEDMTVFESNGRAKLLR